MNLEAISQKTYREDRIEGLGRGVKELEGEIFNGILARVYFG